MTWYWLNCCTRFGFSPYRPSFGRFVGSMYAARHGSGPRTRRNVAGFIVPAPTSELYDVRSRHPFAGPETLQRGDHLLKGHWPFTPLQRRSAYGSR